MSVVRYDLEAPSDEFVGDLTKAAQAMQRTADEADDLSNSMELLSIPARKVGGAAKEAAAGANQAKLAFDGMAQAGAAMGGKMAGASGLLKGFVDGAVKAGSAGGALGLAVTGAAAAVGVLSYAMVKGAAALLEFGRSAADAREDIDGFVNREVIDNLDDLAGRFEHLDLQAKILKGTIGSELLPVIGGLVDELVGLATVAEDAVVALGKVQPPDNAAWRALLAVMTAGTSELGKQLGEIGEQTQEHLQGSLAQVIGSWEKLKKPVEDHKEAVTDIGDAYLENKRLAEAAEKAAIAEIDRRLDQGRQVSEIMTAEEAKLTADKAKAAETRFKIWKSEVERELAEAERMFQDLETQYAEDTAAFEKELAKRQATMDMVFGVMISGAADLSRAVFDGMFQELSDNTRQSVDKIEDAIEISREKIAKWKESDTEASKKLIDDEMAHIEDLEDEKRRILVDAFKDEQALKASQAIMAGALAIMQAFAQLGPIGGALATPLIVGTTAMQVETIQGQAPPSMHDGGVMHDGGADEMMFGGARVRAGEAAVVFNQRAAESGAVERAMQENRDQGGPREAKLVLADFGRVVGEALVKESRRPGSKVGAFGSSGNRDPYGGS